MLENNFTRKKFLDLNRNSLIAFLRIHHTRFCGFFFKLKWRFVNLAWKKLQFAGSLEWMVFALSKLISGKKSQKYEENKEELQLVQETSK
jgi:hypothetical protein